MRLILETWRYDKSNNDINDDESPYYNGGYGDTRNYKDNDGVYDDREQQF